VWISFILIIAGWSIGRGYKKHQNRIVLGLATSGVLFLLIGTFLEGRLSIILESAVFVTGGLLLTVAHWKNYKLEGAYSLAKNSN
jgi:hypothetical protein